MQLLDWLPAQASPAALHVDINAERFRLEQPRRHRVHRRLPRVTTITEVHGGLSVDRRVRRAAATDGPIAALSTLISA